MEVNSNFSGGLFMVKANVYLTKRTIPTYELLEDDINPILDKHLNPYPYTMQNHRSKQLTNKEYDVVVLENEYLEITVLPSLGGRIYSAVDKRRNQDFLYRNQVIKPRMIGTRGAWFSGGMEFNFPISHSPTTMDRVNYSYHEHADGSASIIFGHIEQLSYMNWKVELKLYPGKAYMEQNVSLANPTSTENRFYFWTNTAIEYDQSVKLIYPFDWCINHMDTSYLQWPMFREVDCRQAGEIPYAYETFGKLLEHGFFGSYHENKDYGVVHVANPKKVKGAKFFSWGNDDNAVAWNRSLTDDDSQYIEIQSGPFETQMVYKFLKPHQSMTWTEYWYPIAGTGGFDYAVKEAAVKVSQLPNQIEFCFAATEELGNCKVVFIRNGSDEEQTVYLSPDQIATVAFQAAGAEQVIGEFGANLHTYPYVLKLFSGNRLIMQMEAGTPKDAFYPDTIRFEDSRVVRTAAEEAVELLNTAIFKESLGLIGEAIDLYEQNLQEVKTCETSLTRLGALYVKTMQPQHAIVYLERSLRHHNRNGEARYHLACAYKQMGDLVKARQLMLDIAADSSIYSASIIELAKLNIKLGRMWEARSLLESAPLKSYAAQCLLSAASRQLGDIESAIQAMRDALDSYEWVKAEKYLLHNSEENLRNLLHFTSGYEQALLPIALEYFDIGLYVDTNKLLQLIKRPTFKSKLIELAITIKQNKYDSKLLDDTLQTSLDHMFINEPVLIQLLMELQGQDRYGVTDYLLGIYYYTVSRVEDALTSLLAAYDKGLRHTSLLYSLGYMLNKHQSDAMLAEIYLVEDLAINPHQNEKSLVLLDTIYAENGEHEKRTKTVELMLQANNKSLVLLALVDALHQLGRWEEALSILEQEEFENWEGREDSGPSYRAVVLALAHQSLEQGNLALTEQWLSRVMQYPTGLNYGDSIRTPLADVFYFHGLLEQALGNTETAILFYRQGAEELLNPDLLHTASSREYASKCKLQLHNHYSEERR